MKTLICRHCGCSLVRLGVSKDKAATYLHEGEEHYFCCQACVDRFATDPRKFLQETKGLIVCPTCLAEKPLPVSATLKWAGQEVHFCKCPLCQEAFQKKPDFYRMRLEGTLPNEGVRDHEGSSVRT